MTVLATASDTDFIADWIVDVGVETVRDDFDFDFFIRPPYMWSARTAPLPGAVRALETVGESIMVKAPDPVLQNVRAVAELERQAVQGLTGLDRLSRIVTDVAGSRPFLVGHAAWFLAWVFVLNTRAEAFDPYPFNLLNLLVSLEAIFLTSFVLMTQNRMTKQADRRAHVDLQVNLLAEQELTAILQMVYALCQKAGTCARVNDTRVEQLLRETDIIQVAVAIERELSTIEAEENPTISRDDT